jgi:hypothetical protein
MLLKPVQVAPLMACQLVLSENMLQGSVICVNRGTFTSMDLAGPVFQVCTDCEKFSVVCRIS